MRTKRAAAIVALLLVAFSLLLCLLLNRGEREPVYQGKPLSYWLSDFWPGRNATLAKKEQDKLAVRQIGTNAIPILLQWISAQDGPLKRKMVTWIAGHPWVPFRVASDIDKNMLGASGFRILGKSQASSAVPALVEIVKTGGGQRTSSYNKVTFAMWALADVDHEAALKAGIQFATNGIITNWSAPPIATNK